jgi:hypothetical protein
MTETAQIDKAVPSKKVNRMLGISLDSWNNVMVGALALAAIAAVIVGVSTFIIIRMQAAEEIATKQEFERYKIDADLKISAANDRAKAAEERAAAANEQAARVEQAARWRIIPSDNKTILDSSLAKGPGGTVTLSWAANDPEALFLAQQIERVFRLANSQIGNTLWHVVLQPRIYSRAIFWDVRIIGQSDPLVEALRSDFSEAGIAHSSDPIPNVINDSPGVTISGGAESNPLIWVGPKRPLN